MTEHAVTIYMYIERCATCTECMSRHAWNTQNTLPCGQHISKLKIWKEISKIGDS